MTNLDDRRPREETGAPSTINDDSFVANLVWFVGLLSTSYLLYVGLLLAFYSIVFMNHATPDFSWGKVRDVALAWVPLFIYSAIGFAGLRFWPRGRFRRWGLSAIVCQTAMAIAALANPGTFPIIDWYR
jgi:hypothetical protein